MKVIINDGGRAAEGFKGEVGDCVARSIAIVTGLPYKEIYDRLAAGQGSQRFTSRDKRQYRDRSRHQASARSGINVKRKWFKDLMAELGFEWTATMGIGSGCTVHLREGEVPARGRHILSLSGHYTALIDGVIYDTHDPSREGNRCVYGYWSYLR